MDYILWIVALLTGFVVGRFFAPRDKTPEEETCDYQKAQLEKDIVYYKKLTKTLADENIEFRRKLNERN